MAGGTPSFVSSNAAENIPVEFTEFSIEGKDSQNYSLKSQPNQITANITQKELVIKNLKLKISRLDGYDTAEFETTPTLEGIISPDEVFCQSARQHSSLRTSRKIYRLYLLPNFLSTVRIRRIIFWLLTHRFLANINISDSFTQIDPITNLWVEAPAGVFPKGSRLIVRKIPHDSDEYEEVIKGLDEDKKQMAERLLCLIFTL